MHLDLTDKQTQNRLMIAGGAAIAVGIVVIVVGAIVGWGWTRIIGATLITLGGLLVGTLVGLTAPRRERMRAMIARARWTIAWIAAALFVLPVVVALGAGIVGVIAATGNVGWRVAGAMLALALLIATVLSTLIALRAVRTAGRRTTTTPNITGEGV